MIKAREKRLSPRRASKLSLVPHSSLKLDVGGGFLGCLWNFNKIESKTVRAFARGVLLGKPRFA
jgi:hypothetical protein